eukprot:2477307-Amphidinium_carterae.1
MKVSASNCSSTPGLDIKIPKSRKRMEDDYKQSQDKRRQKRQNQFRLVANAEELTISKGVRAMIVTTCHVQVTETGLQDRQSDDSIPQADGVILNTRFCVPLRYLMRCLVADSSFDVGALSLRLSSLMHTECLA